MNLTSIEVLYDAIVTHVGILDFLGRADGAAPRAHVSDDTSGSSFRDPGFFS